MKCPECQNKYTPSTWMEDEEGICITCIDARDEEAVAATEQRQPAADDANRRMAAAMAQLPSPQIVEEWRENRSAPVREWGRDRSGKWFPPQVPSRSRAHDPVEVDGILFVAIARWDEETHRTIYQWIVQ